MSKTDFTDEPKGLRVGDKMPDPTTNEELDSKIIDILVSYHIKDMGALKVRNTELKPLTLREATKTMQTHKSSWRTLCDMLLNILSWKSRVCMEQLIGAILTVAVVVFIAWILSYIFG